MKTKKKKGGKVSNDRDSFSQSDANAGELDFQFDNEMETSGGGYHTPKREVKKSGRT